VALRSLWQTKRGAADTGNTLPRLNAQLTDIVSTLKSARQTELALKQHGILAGFGSVGMLMEVVPYLEKVNSNAIALQAAQGSTDRRLATALFEQFGYREPC